MAELKATESGAVRLEDIAAHIGVSRSEVSRVINGRVRAGKGVGPAMRQRILDVAREMNYQPNRAAQNLARGRTDTVALMMVIEKLPDNGNEPTGAHNELSPHYHEIVGALTYTLHQYGMNLLLAQCGGGETDPLMALEEIARSRTCDGIVITDMRVDDQRPELLQRVGLPFVVRGSSPISGVAAVGVDNFQAGYQAIAYLTSLGHRRIAFFNIGADLMSGRGRYQGMCAAQQQTGAIIEYRDDAHFDDGAYLAIKERLTQPDFPTAIFAEDEIGALGAMRALEEAGLRVPEDVSVLACLNARFMQQVAPRLSVLDLHQARVAAEAGRLLARMLRGDAVEPGQRLIAPEIVERGTTGPAR
jgi:DNA-binding LacI/PurR family transcriptional regulator